MTARPTDERRRPLGVEWLLVGAALVYAGLLLAGPIVAMVVGAFGQGAGEFVRQVTSPDALHALQLTVGLAMAATIVNTVFGTAIAWVLVRHDFPGRTLANGLVDLPFAVSPVIAGFMIILLFGRDGWLEPVARALGVTVVFALPGMWLATTFVALPFVIREVMPVLAQLGTEQENAAYTMGAGPWQTFRRVTLPGIRWGLLYGISLTLARALGEFGAVLVVSGSVTGLTETATLFIFRSLDDRNAVGAYAVSTMLALISFTILIGMELLRKRTRTEGP
ncbi:MAG TPA: sulfate ABC transporter permease subunit [Gemmatimonadota bacterium]|nr:sulfate ABC transporter permease subunit [Gemmatimonadota bacterium]